MKKYKILKHDTNYYDKLVAEHFNIDKETYDKLPNETKLECEKNIIKSLETSLNHSTEVSVKLSPSFLYICGGFMLANIAGAIDKGNYTNALALLVASPAIAIIPSLIKAAYKKISVNLEEDKLKSLYTYFTEKHAKLEGQENELKGLRSK